MKIELHLPNTDPVIGTSDDPFLAMAETLLQVPSGAVLPSFPGEKTEAKYVMDREAWERAIADSDNEGSLLPDPRLQSDTAKTWRGIPIEVR
jgi:hypothetical protein